MDGEEPDVGVVIGLQVVPEKDLLEVVGDVRGIAEVRPVQVALVLGVGAGIGQAGEGDGPFLLVRDHADGRTEYGGEEIHVKEVVGLLVGEQERGLVDDGLGRVAAAREDGVLHLLHQRGHREDGLQTAAALDVHIVRRGPFGGLVGGVVEGVLVEEFVVLQVIALVVEGGLARNEQEGGVLALAAIGGTDRQGGDVVVPVIVIVAHRKDGQVEQVDASADPFGDVALDVDTGNLLDVLGVPVDGGVHGPVHEDGADTLEDVDVLLSVFGAEFETQGIPAVIDGHAAGDDLRSVGNGPVGAGPLAGERVGEGVHVQVLEDALVAGGGDGDGIGLEMDFETDEFGIGSEVDGVQGRDEGECARAGGQPEGLLPDGADGDARIREARQVVGPAEADVLDGDFNGVGIVEEAQVDEVPADFAAGLHAGRRGERKQQEECFPESGFHYNKLS